MSKTVDNEVFEKPEKPVKEVKLNKNGKPKKEISPERRAMLLENLKRGRETSAKNRKKNSEAKKIIKKKKVDLIDKTVREQVLKEEADKQSYSAMKKELDELKAKMSAPAKKENVVVEPEKIQPEQIKSKPINIPKTIIEQDEYKAGQRMTNADIVKSINKNRKPKKISTFKSMWD
tara:strand:- start:1322 stop:1849 length:528 start_codon:yes stop_codon:yes gene_type:complete